ncbi:MAG: CvpA family protein, partial [Armatimonadota bacterium]|nr:CvpA family protein [Armatimonadota bacterium]
MVDFFIFLILVVVVSLEAKRGFGRAILDFAALLVACRVASALIPTLSHSIKLAAKTHTNEAYIYAISFIVIGAILLFVAKLIYDTTLISADTFDLPLGAIFGVGVAVVLCHVMVRTIALNIGGSAVPPIIASSFLGKEFLT